MFRVGIDPMDVHMMISALCFARVSNRYTFREVFGVDLGAPTFMNRHRTAIADAVIKFVEA